jgi:hypothetical protein
MIVLVLRHLKLSTFSFIAIVLIYIYIVIVNKMYSCLRLVSFPDVMVLPGRSSIGDSKKKKRVSVQ